MQSAAAIQIQCRHQERARFESHHDHPWLLVELSHDERWAMERGALMDTTVLAYQTLPLETARRLKMSPLLFRLHREPHRFAVCPVTKAGGDPWHSRVLVGRATNNGIVLLDSSVSKLHADLRRGPDGGWHIHDLHSANGTRVDGRAIVPGPDGGQALVSGTVLHLGRKRCDFVTSAGLHDVLTADRISSRWLHP